MPGFWISIDTEGLNIFCKNDRVLNIALECNGWRVLNISRLRICQVSAYASVTLDFEFAWI